VTKGYGADLAHIHDAGYAAFARMASPRVVELLRRERDRARSGRRARLRQRADGARAD